MVKVSVYQYGDTFKIVYFKRSGSEKTFNFDGVEGVENIEKLSNNICRARGRITELSLCNPWEFFVTLTLDKTKQDRYSLETYVQDLGVWIGNYNKKYGCVLKYVLVPEQHKDGAWHMHGLLHDLHDNSLRRNENGYLGLPYYENRFGYFSASPIRDNVKISRYITKYVNKDIGTRKSDVGKHLFYASRGLSGKSLSGEFRCCHIPDNVAFQNDFCAIEWANDVTALDTLMARLNILS